MKDAVDAAIHQLADSVNTWLSNVMSLPRAREAGAVLQSELRPGLVRSRTGLVGLDRRIVGGARLGLMAHLLLNLPEGTDPLGVQIDRTLLSLPTPRGLRLRMAEAVEQTLNVLPDDRPAKISILQPGCGALLARLLPHVVQAGAEISVIDGDPQTLAFVDAGLQTRPAGVALRMIHADLSMLGETGLGALLEPQDVIIVNGLVDHLPSRLVGPLLAAVKAALAPSGLLVLTAMQTTKDARFMEHLLGWPLMRRDPGDLLGLFRASELRPKIACSGDQTDHGGLVITALQAESGQDS
jgi:2-polyprenyl-3-methyl-5-hydroxy-6-metoxy-1,4-benzoquinol methylase